MPEGKTDREEPSESVQALTATSPVAITGRPSAAYSSNGGMKRHSTQSMHSIRQPTEAAFTEKSAHQQLQQQSAQSTIDPKARDDDSHSPEISRSVARSMSMERSHYEASSSLPVVEEAGEAGSMGGKSGTSVGDGGAATNNADVVIVARDQQRSEVFIDDTTAVASETVTTTTIPATSQEPHPQVRCALASARNQRAVSLNGRAADNPTSRTVNNHNILPDDRPTSQRPGSMRSVDIGHEKGVDMLGELNQSPPHLDLLGQTA